MSWRVLVEVLRRALGRLLARSLGWCAGPAGTGLHGDSVGYAVAAVPAVGLAAVTIYDGHRVWGGFAGATYLLAALGSIIVLVRYDRVGSMSDALRGRRLVAGFALLGALLVPLLLLVRRRAAGIPWSAQPEVAVVERAGNALLAAGTPYPAVGAGAHFSEFVPYLPGMVLFGIPRVLAGDSPLTDARVWFTLTSTALVLLACRVLAGGGRMRAAPVPALAPDVAELRRRHTCLRGLQLFAVAPSTTLALATGGDDVPVLGLVLLGFALATCHRTVGAGLVLGAAVATKLTALPAVAVLAVTLRHTHGGREAAHFVAAAGTVATVAIMPFLVRDPAAFVDHVLRYPAGLTPVDSPAASPLPGYLIAQTGGQTLALLALGIAAAGLGGRLLARPPADPAAAAAYTALGMLTAMLLMPASRFGYLLFPVALFGIALLLRATPAAPSPGGVPAKSISSSFASRRRDRAALPPTRTARGARSRTTGRWTRRAP